MQRRGGNPGHLLPLLPSQASKNFTNQGPGPASQGRQAVTNPHTFLCRRNKFFLPIFPHFSPTSAVATSLSSGSFLSPAPSYAFRNSCARSARRAGGRAGGVQVSGAAHPALPPCARKHGRWRDNSAARPALPSQCKNAWLGRLAGELLAGMELPGNEPVPQQPKNAEHAHPPSRAPACCTKRKILGRHLPGDAKRMQNISTLCSSSAKSTHDQTCERHSAHSTRSISSWRGGIGME